MPRSKRFLESVISYKGDASEKKSAYEKTLYKEDVESLDKYIRFKMKSEHVLIGYVDTCSEFKNFEIKRLLYGELCYSERLFIYNYFYLYKYEGADNLLKALQITEHSNFQVFIKPKTIEIYKIIGNFNIDLRHPKRGDSAVKLFVIKPISEKEYKKISTFHQPIYWLGKRISSVPQK